MDVICKCPFCKKTKAVRVNQEGYYAWRSGKSIQEALPKLKPEDREMLISGICGKCWNDMFSDEEED